MLLDKEHIVTILKNYKPQLTSEMGIKRIALFGSYARNTQTLESDIDLLIEQNSINYQKLVKTLLFIEEKFPGTKIQLTRKGPHLSDKFLKAIEKDLIYV